MTVAGEVLDPVPDPERPAFCMCGRRHPCPKCWPDKRPPGFEDVQLTLELD